MTKGNLHIFWTNEELGVGIAGGGERNRTFRTRNVSIGHGCPHF